jgi:hypothetical protein
MITRWLSVMGECDARTQGAFICGAYGRARGRGSVPPSAFRRPVAHSVGASYARRRMPIERDSTSTS